MFEMPEHILVYKITRSDVEKLPYETDDFDLITNTLPSGFYTTFRTYANRTKVVGLRAHLDRLYLPAKLDGIIPVIRQPVALQDILASLLKRMKSRDARVRLILDYKKEPGVIYVLLQPMPDLPDDVYRNGVRLDVSKSNREKPALLRTATIRDTAYDRAKMVGDIFDVLLTKKRLVLEGMKSNFFYVRDNELCTAGRNILIGITRQNVIALAGIIGINVRLKALPLNEINSIEEAFLTNSSYCIIPVVMIRDETIGDGKVGRLTKKLMSLFDKKALTIAEDIVPE